MLTDDGELVRPFSLSAGVSCRGYSMPLQRVITDFGADVSFEDTAAKVKEHYGVEFPASTARLITEKHAGNMRKNIDSIQTPDKPLQAPTRIIAQTDGSMVPIVKIDNKAEGDKRKTRSTAWCEARLALARPQGSATSFVSAIIGTVDEAGKQLADVVGAVGRNESSRIHGIGDGAPWIYDQFDKRFGSSADFLVDFYHVSEYLAKAALCCSPLNSTAWFHEQQQLLKESKVTSVLANLESHINDPDQKEHSCDAVKCHQYIENRPNQFNYKNALDQDLPIGSGEIESAHRSVVQKRLKMPGGWWLKEKAADMLVLRTTRVNGFWNSYWPKHAYAEAVN
jgi:hypothetical protein